LERELKEIDGEIAAAESAILQSRLNIHRMQRQIETRTLNLIRREDDEGETEEKNKSLVPLFPSLMGLKRKFLTSYGIQLKREDKLPPKEEEEKLGAALGQEEEDDTCSDDDGEFPSSKNALNDFSLSEDEDKEDLVFLQRQLQN